ncbi:MAG: glycosyltransferase family 2 protein [Planctomycetes bacterium]|nr:glycosyltransferase family 2 protein [Planctomycetota bacterium]
MSDDILVQGYRDDSTCDVSFFVPCLNEANNIVATLETIQDACRVAQVDSYEILVVDDGSSDNTSGIVKEYAREHPGLNIHLRVNPCNLGLGRNYAECAYIAQGHHYMMIAGDNAEPRDSIVAILSQMGKADMVIPYFGEQEQRNALRKAISHTFTAVVNFLSGNTIHYYNGSILHKRLNVMRWHSDTHGFAYQAQIVTRLRDEGGTYVEVNVPNNDRMQGASTAFRLENFVSVSHCLLQIFLRRIRKTLFFSTYNEQVRKRAEARENIQQGGADQDSGKETL